MKKFFLLLIFLFLFSPIFVHAQSGMTMSITPPLIKNNVSPGQIWKSSVKITNNNKEEINVYVETLDFKGSSESGAVEFLTDVSENEEENKHLLSRWIVIDPGPIKIPAQTSKEISFIIDVPEEVSPGGHYAAILAGTKPPQDQVEGTSIKISSLLGSLILLNVKGDVKEEGKIREFSSEKGVYEKAEVEFTVRFQNTGNVHIQPRGEIRVYNWLGKDKGHMTLNHNSEFGNVLPQGIRKWNFSWKGEEGILEMGRYRAVLILGYGQEGRQTDTREFYFWVLNFKVIGIAAGMFLFVLFFFIFIVRTYIKRTIKNAQKQVEMMAPPQTKVRQRTIQAERKVVDLKQAPRAVKRSIERKQKPKSSVWKFFRNFILFVLFIIICIASFLFYGNYSEKLRSKNEGISEKSPSVEVVADEKVEVQEKEKEKEKEESQVATSSDLKNEEAEEDQKLIKKEDLKIVILNGSGTSGKAGEAGKIFEEAGYKIERLGNADSFEYLKTKIEYKKEYKDFAKSVADMMLVDAELLVNNLLGEDLLIVVGKDF